MLSELSFTVSAPGTKYSEYKRQVQLIFRKAYKKVSSLSWYYTQTTLKITIRKLLELISEFSKVAQYKINTQKSLVFLYYNYEKSESEIKEPIPFTIATKIIKYLGISLLKEIKELYAENAKNYWMKSKMN